MEGLSASSTIVRVRFEDGTIGEGYRPALEEFAQQRGSAFEIIEERLVFL